MSTCKHGLEFLDGDECCGLCAGEEINALKARIAELEQRMFPIMGGPAIPWSVIAPHERQAQLNHSQSLEMLASRGGLGTDEAVAVLEDRRWVSMGQDEARTRLRELAGWLLPEDEKRLRAQYEDRLEIVAEECEGWREQARVAGEERDQLRARPELHAGLHPEVPSSEGAFFTFQEVTQLRGAIHHTNECLAKLRVPWCCICGCANAFDLLNRKGLYLSTPSTSGIRSPLTPGGPMPRTPRRKPAPGVILNASTAEEVARMASEAKGPVVLDFIEEGCGFCDEEAPKVEEVVKSCAGLTVIRVDATKDDSLNQLADDFKIEGFPTLFYADKGGDLTPDKASMLDDADALKKRAKCPRTVAAPASTTPQV